LAASLSQRVATRRHCLIFVEDVSTSARILLVNPPPDRPIDCLLFRLMHAQQETRARGKASFDHLVGGRQTA